MAVWSIYVSCVLFCSRFVVLVSTYDCIIFILPSKTSDALRREGFLREDRGRGTGAPVFFLGSSLEELRDSFAHKLTLNCLNSQIDLKTHVLGILIYIRVSPTRKMAFRRFWVKMG